MDGSKALLMGSSTEPFPSSFQGLTNGLPSFHLTFGFRRPGGFAIDIHLALERIVVDTFIVFISTIDAARDCRRRGWREAGISVDSISFASADRQREMRDRDAPFGSGRLYLRDDRASSGTC